MGTSDNLERTRLVLMALDSVPWEDFNEEERIVVARTQSEYGVQALLPDWQQTGMHDDELAELEAIARKHGV